MATRSRLAGKRLPLTLAFGALVAAAIGAACNGFFVNPTLTSLTISPTSPAVQVGKTISLSAYGVYSDGTGSYLTSGVSWSSSDPSEATVTGSGGATLKGIAIGSPTITAASEAVTNTATANVYMPISAIGIKPTNPSVTVGTSQAFLVYANGDSTLTNPDDNLSLQATLTVTQTGTAVSIPACTPTASDTPPDQECTTAGLTTLPATFLITVTYPGTTLTATTNLTVDPAP